MLREAGTINSRSSSCLPHHGEQLCGGIPACWAPNSSNPLAKFFGLASLTALNVPHEKKDDCGEEGVSSQLTHLLCSASHFSWALALIPRLRALVLLGSNPWQLPQVPQSVALHWSHSLHRSRVSHSERFMGRLGSGKMGLCLGSSLSLLPSFLPTFIILVHSFHLTLPFLPFLETPLPSFSLLSSNCFSLFAFWGFLFSEPTGYQESGCIPGQRSLCMQDSEQCWD